MARLVTASRCATIEWMTLPTDTQHTLQFTLHQRLVCLHLHINVTFHINKHKLHKPSNNENEVETDCEWSRAVLTWIVIKEPDVSVLMSSDCHWKSWMTDDAVHLTPHGILCHRHNHKQLLQLAITTTSSSASTLRLKNMCHSIVMII